MIGKVLKRVFIFFMLLFFLGGVIYFRFPGLIVESAIHAMRWWTGLKRYELQVDDHRWVYLSGGEGDSILFIHGFGADKDRWGIFLRAFRKDYRLIVPDLPGFGENSRIPSVSYDIPNQVKRLTRFIEALGLRNFHLVGISMGGYIAAYYAGEHPERVKSLVLMDTAGVKGRIPSDAWRLYKTEGKNVLIYKTQYQLDQLMSMLFYRPPWIPRRLKEYFVERVIPKNNFRLKILNDMLKGGMYLLEDRLHKIEARTLIIWGSKDCITHVSCVQKLKKGIRDSRVEIINDCGHVPYLEKTEEVRRLYRKFLDDLSVTTK